MNTRTDLEYFTKDLPTAAYLLAKGKSLQRIEREGKICWFVFADRLNCEQLSNEFWFNSNSNIHAKSFYEAIQTLKNRIFSER